MTIQTHTSSLCEGETKESVKENREDERTSNKIFCEMAR